MLNLANCKTLLLALTLITGLALTGCSTTKRVVTNTLWSDGDVSSTHDSKHHLYLSYWEGTCRSKYLGGCSRGDSHVKYCTAVAGNGLQCDTVAELDALLEK